MNYCFSETGPGYTKRGKGRHESGRYDQSRRLACDL